VSVDALHRYLEASAASHGRRTAVVDGSRAMDYGELEAAANRLAHLLAELGARRGDRVGLYLDKSIESVVAAYGVMKAGAGYVPLDPSAPPARLGRIAADCGLRLLCSAAGKSGAWTDLAKAGASLDAVVVLDGPADGSGGPPGVRIAGTETLGTRPPMPPDAACAPDDLAYILYTSGSTGDPKGVTLAHRNAVSFVEWAGALIGVGPEDRLSSHAPMHFDLSVFDLYAAARGGASVTLVPRAASVLPRELARFLGEARITVWYSVPSVLTALTARGGLRPGDLPDLRAVIFAGEVFPPKFLRRLMELLPHAAFYNWYGPTETNVCTWYRVPGIPDADDPIPIGRAIAGTDVFAVGDDGRRAGPGEVGELHVRGPGVMRGYWGDPDRTARVLVADPTQGSGGPVYRTGDLVRELEDGNLVFLGRRDAQIKSRGHRIELGEVETTLLAHPSVLEVAVVAVPDEMVTNRLRAVVVAPGATDRELAGFCRERLPRYMVPEEFRFVDALPKTSTGKIDHRSLEAEIGAEESDAAPFAEHAEGR
jgi:amino acid adenylation domain-containing protein